MGNLVSRTSSSSSDEKSRKIIEYGAYTVTVAAISFAAFKLYKHFYSKNAEITPEQGTSKESVDQLVRVDSQLDIPILTPTGKAQFNPFEFSQEKMVEFSVESLGLTVSHFENLKPEKNQNFFYFGGVKSGISLLVIEKNITKDVLLQLLKIQKNEKYNQKIVKINRNRTTAIEIEHKKPNGMLWSLFVSNMFGRSFVFQYESKGKYNIEDIKKMAYSLTFEEPPTKGIASVRVLKYNLKMKLPLPFYRARKHDETENEDMILDIYDARYSPNITTGIRIKKRYEKTLEDLIAKRKSELEEKNPKEEDSTYLHKHIDTVMLKYNKKIKNEHFAIVEVCFIHHRTGFIAQIFARDDLHEKFNKIALNCVSSITFDERSIDDEWKIDTIVYEEPISAVSIEVPATSEIHEYPIQEGVIAEFEHETSDNIEFKTVLHSRKQTASTNIETYTSSYLEKIEEQKRRSDEQGTPKAIELIDKEIVDLHGNKALQLKMKTLYPYTLTDKLNTRQTCVIKDGTLFQLHTQFPENCEQSDDKFAITECIHNHLKFSS